MHACMGANVFAGVSARPGEHSDPSTDSWFKDPSIGALEAAKILRTRLERFGPQSMLLRLAGPPILLALASQVRHAQVSVAVDMTKAGVIGLCPSRTMWERSQQALQA